MGDVVVAFNAIMRQTIFLIVALATKEPFRGFVAFGNTYVSRLLASHELF